MTDSADYGSRNGEAAERLTLVTGGPRAEAAPKRQRDPEVFFDRAELDAILSVYGRKVAEGEWRDYAMGGFKDVAIFSVFRRASEMPLYRIEKRPKLARRQGVYSVVAATGLVLKRGHELKQVLKVFEKRALRLIDA
ncbi:DUF2794 domain-containing protein [Parvibaculum sp.]|uniref:DUF2794 domain-containing protein n=1 Tax=Parvibaculum sp. TaxID=2024848 RepID=UPI001AFD412C|nr:DUF2794 domain-containing protein [Parvibaculum sp.]MBO6633674.1 DUF2794 domain-containing protein [Parvibaculum sp.]MBO6677303.1 DUF2794 domain-containing protein [Parvibaculum sp.]MBO6684959.1 DUF2794 domain-containing protein [Parvibaculum sp.]MBO6905323.1 DUF2794 domain-containing protein [Parvibaculum sp.]